MTGDSEDYWFKAVRAKERLHSLSLSLSLSLSMKKQQGCEIEARGISFIIPVPRRAHPFKIWSREGEEEQVPDLEHGNGPMGRKGGGDRHVLKNVSFRAKPWEILAIVGPSGAGKSTLLEILAGRLAPQSPAPAVFVDDKPVVRAAFKKLSGYVAQRDILFPLLTVRETLTFAAKLRLSLPPRELRKRVEALLSELGLAHVADTRVGDGDGRVRGVSGGERRRVSIGVAVVHDPTVLILDEPTSGLDSASALQVLDMVKAMAESRGRTIVLSIHQPGFRIVKLFGSLLLLSGGAALHHGTADQLRSLLADAGLPLPPRINVVEFAIDSIDALHHHHYNRHQEHQQQLDYALQAHSRRTLQQLFHLGETHGGAAVHCDGISYANSWVGETAILAHRFSKIVLRTKQLFVGRTVQMLAAGLALGSIFHGLDDASLVGARERLGLFAFILTFLLSCTTEALPIFLQEREILTRETASGSYRVSSYAIANALVFLPFLLVLAVVFSVPLYWLAGLNRSFTAFAYFVLLIWLILYTANSVVACFSALAPNFIVGNSLISGVMGSFFLFSGYFISREGMPGCWVFMHYVSLFKYPFEGFLVNEFSGECLESTSDGACLLSGDVVLGGEGLGKSSRWRNVGIMLGFILAYRFLSYLILRSRSGWLTC